MDTRIALVSQAGDVCARFCSFLHVFQIFRTWPGSLRFMHDACSVAYNDGSWHKV